MNMPQITQYLIQQPHWLVVAIIGSVIGVSLKPMFYLIYYLAKISKKKDIECKWFGYFYIKKNSCNYIGKETLFIRKGVFNNYIIKGVSITTKGQQYSGVVIMERNFLVIKMKPEIHEEEIFIRLKRSIPGNDEIMVGLWSALDFDGNAAAGPMVLSRQEINEDQLNDIIKNNITMLEKIKIMSVK